MSSVKQIKTLVQNSVKGRVTEKQLEELDYSVDAMVESLASLVRMKPETVEKAITQFKIEGEDRELWASMQIPRHGPLDDIIPHDCHITITLCNPLPWGPQKCLVIELPWPCPDAKIP